MLAYGGVSKNVHQRIENLTGVTISEEYFLKEQTE
jgi:hypothetical protein